MDITGRQAVFLLCPREGVVATSGARSHVDFNFAIHHMVYEYYHNVLLTRTVQLNVMTKSVHMDVNQFMNPGQNQIIDEELRDWPLDDGLRRNLSILAFNKANIIAARSMSPQHNVLIIHFGVVMITMRRALDENLAMELMAQRSMEESVADSGMVPATDSSVESLKIRTAASCKDDECCSICLEDFYVGCEVLSMPCSHIFHENCIKKWLKSSHYCPIRRFEMPTKT